MLMAMVIADSFQNHLIYNQANMYTLLSGKIGTEVYLITGKETVKN